MQLKRKITKNYPPNVISPISSANQRLVVKSQSQSWIEIHEQNIITDVISLPHQLRMSKVQLCVDESSCKFGKSQYIFYWNHTLFIGTALQNRMEVQIGQFALHNSIFESNPINISPSTYCNISLNSANESEFNIFSLGQSLEIKNSKNPLTYNISHYSNLLQASNRIYYVSNNPKDQNVVCYDLHDGGVVTSLQLPDLDMQAGMNCLLIPHPHHQLVCAYGKNWLAIADLRVGGLIGLQELYYCESAFVLPSQNNLSVHYTQQNFVYQFDMRKWSSNRTPFLTHSNSITNTSLLNNSLLKVEDFESSDIYLYKKE